jgi:hypothetical protein
MPFYISVGPRGILFRIGMMMTGAMGSASYWRACRNRPEIAVPPASPRVVQTRIVEDGDPTISGGNGVL